MKPSLRTELLTSFAIMAVAPLGGCMHFAAPRVPRGTGIVVDEQRHPVASATVEIYRLVNRGSSFLPRELELMETVLADGQGRFQFKAFESSMVLVGAT